MFWNWPLAMLFEHQPQCIGSTIALLHLDLA